jgi:7-cyano-7-deazaguanine synthase in queuosine biosynthesis
MKNVVILFSGGVDSLALLSIACSRGIHPVLLHIQYDHPAAAQELLAVKALYGKFADCCNLYLHEAAIHSEAMSLGVGVQGSREVRGRNLMFLAMAYNLSTHFFGDEYFYTWVGASKADQADYFDCSSSFIHIAGLLTPNMGLYAPLIQCDKTEILGLIDPAVKDLAWSCYEPKLGEQCGECNSCKQYI